MRTQLRMLVFLSCGACATADSQPRGDAEGSQFGEEDTNPCEERSRTALAMDDVAPNGVKPQDVANAVEGAHAATLTWAAARRRTSRSRRPARAMRPGWSTTSPARAISAATARPRWS